MSPSNNSTNPLQKFNEKYLSGGRWVVIVALVICILGLFTWMNYKVAGNYGDWGKTDFMLIWLGGKGLAEGIDMYDPTAWEQLHVRYAGIYRDNPVFLYPLPAAFLFYPFGLFDVKVGATLWLLFSEIILLLSVGYFINKLKRPRSKWSTFILILAVVIFEPVLIVIWSGQYSAFMVLLLVGYYALAEKRYDWAAGVCLTLLPLRPNPMVILVPALLAWAIWQRRWKIVIGSAVTGLILLGTSLIMRPGWIEIWLNWTIGGSGKLQKYIRITSTLWGMVYDVGAHLSSNWQTVINVGLSLIVCIVTLWWLLKTKNFSLGTVIAVSTSVSLFVTPYAWNYDQILLLFPLLYILVCAEGGSEKLRWVAWAGVIFLLAVVPYIFRYIAILRHRDPFSALITLGVLIWVLWAIKVFPERASQ